MESPHRPRPSPPVIDIEVGGADCTRTLYNHHRSDRKCRQAPPLPEEEAPPAAVSHRKSQLVALGPKRKSRLFPGLRRKSWALLPAHTGSPASPGPQNRKLRLSRPQTGSPASSCPDRKSHLAGTLHHRKSRPQRYVTSQSPDAWVPPGGGGHFAARLLQESPSPAALGGAWPRKPRLPSRGQGFPTANQRGSESTKTCPLPGGDASKLGKLRPPQAQAFPPG